MKIPHYARYEYCNQKACEFLEEFRIKSFPIDSESIIRQKKWGLVKYSELMKVFQCDRNYVKRCLGSNDGFTSWDGNNYTISYNDDEKLGDRTRFTLMHEIGHIYLNHLTDFEATKIYRGSLSKAENKVLENEANAFARNVLSPVSMYLTLKNKSVLNVARTFGLTQTAAETRIDFINRDVELIKTLKLTQKIMLVYHRFMKKRKCTTCGAQLFNNYLYCPICGHKTLQWGDGIMIYDKLDTDDYGKLKECPICGNEETNITGNHCQICGTYLVNNCTEEDCEYSIDVLPSNARYCPICGNESTFHRSGILKNWNHQENNQSSEQGFMSIPEPIDEELPFL